MRKLTLRADRLAELRTDELGRIAAAQNTPLCPVLSVVHDLLTGMCITQPPPTQNQLNCLTQGCS